MDSTNHRADSLAQLLIDIALSTARIRAMADQAHQLVEELEHRRQPMMTLAKAWSRRDEERRPPCSS
jgi:hypothetical protein